MIVLHNYSLPDDGPVRPEICRNFHIKHYCSSGEVCAFVGHLVTIEFLHLYVLINILLMRIPL